MLVALAARIASNLDPVALLAIPGERLAIAGTPNTSLGHLAPRLIRRGVVVVDSAVVGDILLHLHRFIRQARRWGRQAPDDTRGSRGPRYRVSATGRVVYGEGRGQGNIFTQSGSKSIDIRLRVGHGFPTSDSVVGIEGTSQKGGVGVGVGS